MRITAFLVICLVLWPCLGLAADSVNTRPNPEELLASVRLVVDDPEASVDWLKVARAIARLGKLGEPQAKSLLVDILRREVPLRLAEGVPLPGVMPPLEILKAAAIEALVKLKAKEALPEIERIARTTDFQVLRDKANNASLALRRQ